MDMVLQTLLRLPGDAAEDAGTLAAVDGCTPRSGTMRAAPTGVRVLACLYTTAQVLSGIQQMLESMLWHGAARGS
jgi:hypothetical protein